MGSTTKAVNTLSLAVSFGSALKTLQSLNGVQRILKNVRVSAPMVAWSDVSAAKVHQ